MKRKFLASAFVFFAAFLVFNSCNKIDTTNLGDNLIPEIDNINTFDTILSVVSDNLLFDDTTRMFYSEPHALGIIENDIEFGKTTAAIYSSFTPTSYRTYPFTNKRDSVTLDSVVLSLACTAVYGDSNSVQQVEVREISRFQQFSDSVYLISHPDFLTEAAVVGSKTVDFRTLNDTTIYRNGKDTIRSNNQMRIHLDTAWARRFVNYDTTNSSPYNSDTSFKTAFRGLEIKVNESSPTKTALAYINLDDNDRTRITFYYRVVNNGRTDTSAAIFTYTSDPHANLIRRTPAGNYAANLNNGDPNDAKIYIQSSPGSYATVKIPGLDNLTNRVIHRAELICDRFPSEENFYAPPSLMFIDIPGTGDSTFTIRNDFIPSTTSGRYDVNTIGGNFNKNRYVFNLSRYIQSMVTKGYSNPTLRIYAPFSTYQYYVAPNNTVQTSGSARGKFLFLVNEPIGFGRVVLYGGSEADDNKRMRLRIIYSKI